MKRKRKKRDDSNYEGPKKKLKLDDINHNTKLSLSRKGDVCKILKALFGGNEEKKKLYKFEVEKQILGRSSNDLPDHLVIPSRVKIAYRKLLLSYRKYLSSDRMEDACGEKNGFCIFQCKCHLYPDHYDHCDCCTIQANFINPSEFLEAADTLMNFGNEESMVLVSDFFRMNIEEMMNISIEDNSRELEAYGASYEQLDLLTEDEIIQRIMEFVEKIGNEFIGMKKIMSGKGRKKVRGNLIAVREKLVIEDECITEEQEEVKKRIMSQKL